MTKKIHRGAGEFVVEVFHGDNKTAEAIFRHVQAHAHLGR